MRHFTSDTHFSHRNIIEYSNRPFADTAEMNEMIVKWWNDTVAPGDTVFHLGDVALGPVAEWDNVLSRLNGYKILVVGNHERIFKGNKPKYQEKFEGYYEQFFDEVHHDMRGLWLDDGTIVDLSHYPYDGDHTDEDRYSEYRLEDRGRVLIHGHVHREYHGTDEDERDRVAVTKSKRGSLQIHVGMDNWGYKPVSEDRIIEILEKH